MKTETDNTLDTYQQQIVATREISEAFFEGAGRIENVWLEQTSKIFEEQLKFLQASAAVRDPQGLAALHSAFFSRSPEDLIKTQQKMLDVVTETQTKISDALGKHMSVLKAEDKPLWVTKTTNSASSLAGACYSAWHKAFQNAIELSSVGAKALPLAIPDSGNTPVSKKEETHTKQKTTTSQEVKG